MKTNIMKTIEIDGKSYLIDIEKATEQGLLKEKDSKPRSWEEYTEMHYGQNNTAGFSATNFDMYRQYPYYNRFNTANEAKAFCALGKLIQLRDAWWGDWKPDWEKSNTKYGICAYRNKIDTFGFVLDSCLLAFPTAEMCEDFLETFRNLIMEAKMFL